MAPVAQEVASGVHVVEASHTNFVLVVEGREVTIIDSGYPKDRSLVEAAVREVGRRVANVTAMLLTHAHVDHLGSAEWLRHTHGIPVHCHTAEAQQARGEVHEAISERDLLIRLWRPGVLRFVANAVLSGARRGQPVAEVTTFADGAEVDVPGRPVAIHTPGHTSGHVGFHLPGRGVLVSGDALITVDVWGTGHRGPQLIRAPFNHDHGQAADSLSRFEELDADVVVPGHGRPFTGRPAEAVAQARRAGP